MFPKATQAAELEQQHVGTFKGTIVGQSQSSKHAPGERMFPRNYENVMEATFRTNMPKLRDHLCLTVTQSQQLEREHVSMLKGTIIENDAPRVHDLLTQRTLNPPSPEEEEAWVPETNRLVRETYKEDGDYWLGEAKKLAASRPEFQKVLSETGLGSHPEIVMAFIRGARRLHGHRE